MILHQTAAITDQGYNLYDNWAIRRSFINLPIVLPNTVLPAKLGYPITVISAFGNVIKLLRITLMYWLRIRPV